MEAAEAQAEQARMYVKELSRYVEEQERIRVQFTQVEKLSAVGSLASGVAHDFNNCLAVICGRAELMLKYTSDEKMRRGLELIVQSARDGAKTVKRIQDFARQRQDRDFETVSIDRLLFDVSEITRPRWKDESEAAGKQINFTLSNRSGAHISGDASELRDVLVNMIFNAVEAMHGGGRLTLTAEQHDEKVDRHGRRHGLRDEPGGSLARVRPVLHDERRRRHGARALGQLRRHTPPRRHDKGRVGGRARLELPRRPPARGLRRARAGRRGLRRARTARRRRGAA